MAKRESGGELVVIDPAVHTPELTCFNLLARLSPLPVTYHLPALYGFGSLKAIAKARAVKGLFILGSQASVHEPLSWQVELRSYLQAYLAAATPIVGFCYGHQLLAHMLGGRVGLHPSGVKQKGMRQVQMTQDRRLGLSGRESGSLIVSHREVVDDVPPGMETFASSEHLAIEGLRHRSLPIWTLQAHPEATPEFCAHQAVPWDEQPQSLQFGWQLVEHFLHFMAHPQGA